MYLQVADTANHAVNNTTNTNSAINTAHTSNPTIRCELMANIDSLYNYYASIRAPAIIIHGLRIGRVFAEYRDNLVVIDGENKKEREYLIPKSKVDQYGENGVYFNISESSLKEFEI